MLPQGSSIKLFLIFGTKPVDLDGLSWILPPAILKKMKEISIGLNQASYLGPNIINYLVKHMFSLFQ